MGEAYDASWHDILWTRRSSPKPWLILPRAPCASSAHDSIAYGELWNLASGFAAGLERAGVARGEAVLVICDNSLENCIAVLGTMLRGAALVPAPPPGLGQGRQVFTRELEARARDAGARLVVTAKPLDVGWGNVQTVADLLRDGAGRRAPPDRAEPEQIALIQYTSGTTEGPRGVELSLFNIAANLRGIAHAVDARADDVVGCWLPMFHDMGLIGSLLYATYWGMPLVLSSPRKFIFSPESWLWSIARFGVTCSAAPNSAYETCVSRVADRKLHGLDLSRWRVAVNGGELVQAATLQRFGARFAQRGFAPWAMRATYGMAENTVAVSFSAAGSAPSIDSVDAQHLHLAGRARPCPEGAPDARLVVGVGRPITGHALRVVDGGSLLLPDRQVGEVQVQGPASTRGYRGRPQAGLFDAGWLRTGDRGYLVDGELFLLGRTKHVIKHAGRSIDAALLEGAVRACLPAAVRGVAVFGHASAASGTEEIVVLIEAARCSADGAAQLIASARRAVQEAAQVSPELVRLVPPGSVPRTTSGKVRHADAQRQFLGAVTC